MPITLETLLTDLPRVQEKYYKKLEKLGLITVEDLLRHFPVRYDDLSQISPLSDIREDSAVTVVVTVEKVTAKTIPGRKLHLTNATFSDASGTVRAIWFNQRFIEKSLEVGTEIRMSGKVKSDKNGLFLSAPDIERSARVPSSTGCIVPIYGETAGLSSKWLRWQIQLILDTNIVFPDLIPQEIREKENFLDLAQAFRIIHFPDSGQQVENAQRRFAFEDLFVLQIYALKSRALYAGGSAQAIPFDEDLIKEFVTTLPFELTNAQRKASFQILTDISKDTPMNRLLNGDVGAGKTLVAMIAALQTASVDAQIAFLAPTEVLAKQHFATFLQLLEKHDISIALLTGSYKVYGTCSALAQTTTRPKLLEKISSGDIKIILGTHALIQEDVKFKNLALVIVDEQQRFGVDQRSALIDNARKKDASTGKSYSPHFLTMTATPIPRTFSLALFGDLHVSLLDEKPAKRKEIKTAIVTPSRQKQIYNFIADELSAGRQGYVILPLVEQSKALANLKAATVERDRLAQDVFPEFTIGLLHGKMKSAEKEAVMQKFKAGKINLLVSTSVVEVGVDVPNATVMIIENAERFGLSQLHQFRGRIGRNDMQSYCFLFSVSSNNQRLRALEKNTDGFRLAEIDLQLRGPGEFIGKRQSGLPDGAMKNITNITLVTKTREAAREVLIADPALTKQLPLKLALQRFEKRVHME